MSDKYRDLLEQYDVKVISTFRSRGTFQCETDQGLALLKEYHSSLRKLAMEYEWKEKLAEAGYDRAYGARPLRRAIQTNIEDAFAEEYLKGTFRAGDHVSIGVKTGGYAFRVVK